MTQAQGLRRIELFMAIIGALSREASRACSPAQATCPIPSGYMSTGMNKALAYIRENLTQPFNESDLAAIAGQSPSAFSRSFADTPACRCCSTSSGCASIWPARC